MNNTIGRSARLGAFLGILLLGGCGHGINAPIDVFVPEDQRGHAAEIGRSLAAEGGAIWPSRIDPNSKPLGLYCIVNDPYCTGIGVSVYRRDDGVLRLMVFDDRYRVMNHYKFDGESLNLIEGIYKAAVNRFGADRVVAGFRAYQSYGRDPCFEFPAPSPVCEGALRGLRVDPIKSR
jgi:hypothetical protein